MALEDYKISNDAVMCWDSDGRLNTNIWPDNLKNNTVTTILARIDEFALIKGLVLDGDYFKQYCKINGSLYLMCDEVKKLRNSAMRQKVASPILNQLKKYMKEEGFVWDSSSQVYDSPTDKFPQNKTSFVGIEETNFWSGVLEECWMEVYPKDKTFYLKFNQRHCDFENSTTGLRLDIVIDPYKEDQHYNGFTEENFEKFKKDWVDYKEHLIPRLEAFKKKVEEKKLLLDNSLKDTTDKLKKLQYRKDDYGGYGVESWYKDKRVENNLLLKGFINLDKILKETTDYKVKYWVTFKVYQGRDEIWGGGNYWSYRTNEEALPKGLTPALLKSILGNNDINYVDSVEEANKIIEKGFADYEDAFLEDEIGFDGHENLSLTEALKKLRDIEN